MNILYIRVYIRIEVYILPNTIYTYVKSASLRFSLHRNSRLLLCPMRPTLDIRYRTVIPVIMSDMFKLMLICLHPLLIRLGRIQIDIIAVRSGSGHTMHMSRQGHDPHKYVIFHWQSSFLFAVARPHAQETRRNGQ